MNFSGIKKILVIKLRHIGDVLLSVPVFRALRENFPDAHIAALVNSGTEEVLDSSPFINEIIAFDRSIKKINSLQKYIKEISLLNMVRRKGFDMTVDLTGGDRAAITSFVSGASYRLAHDTRGGFGGKKYLYTHLAARNDNQHTALQNLDVVRQFGIKSDNLSVDISIPESARIFAKNIVSHNRTDNVAPVVHVHPTSRWLFKCWKDEYMAEVISWLTDRGIIVIVTSAPDKREMEKAKKILSMVRTLGDSPRFTGEAVESGLSPRLICGGVVDLCGKTNIKQLAAISEVSDLFFGVDSAPTHIAAAVGTPVVALFGPSGAFHWGPWDNESSKLSIKSLEFKTPRGDSPRFTDGAKQSRRIGTVPVGQTEETPYPKRNGIQTFGIHTVIQQDWKCVPCGKDGCDGSKISRCLEEIKTEEVINILKGKLNI
ncbi:MAG: putative lipopolysaccharide heptosyltransferase III [Nitrospirota bacterium]|nr:putative lipopolysaccharide heptosyltransferase III [Nitrospirota bacterium]